MNVGDILAGKYRVDRILGMGGMGMVVAVTHLELEQRLAIKLMRADAATSASAKDRFLREARAAVRLRGEHVCRVYDVGKLDDGQPYITMELLEGEDFARLVSKRAPMAVSETVDYMLQALEGVAEAHANGIVHRDLKPGNLFAAVDNDGSPLVKVLDFGISKSSAVGGITQTGDVMGSPSYMAPEHMESAKDVDVRADIWAIGVILYQMTSRRLPFEQESLPALCAALVAEDPKRLDQLVKVPAEFSAVVMRCLEKKRDNRFENVGELALALAPFGGANAAQSAQRVVNVLRRRKAPSKAPEAFDKTIDPSAATAATQATQATGAVSGPALLGQASTFSTGSAEAYESMPPRKSRRAGIVVGLAALVTVVVVVTAVSTSSKKSTSSAKDDVGSASRAPSPPPAPEPTPAPVPTPVVEAPVEAPVATGSSALAPVTQPKPKQKITSSAKTTTAKTTTTNATTPPPAAGPVDAGVGDPIYKGTKPKIITTYPGQ